jgi:hypothetical protein
MEREIQRRRTNLLNQMQETFTKHQGEEAMDCCRSYLLGLGWARGTGRIHCHCGRRWRSGTGGETAPGKQPKLVLKTVTEN